nr:mitochondrial ribosomal protein l23 [Hymenolepis microstoma]
MLLRTRDSPLALHFLTFFPENLNATRKLLMFTSSYVKLAPGHEFEFPDIFKDGKRPSTQIEQLMESSHIRDDLQPAEEDKEKVQEEVKKLESAQKEPKVPSHVINKWFS